MNNPIDERTKNEVFEYLKLCDSVLVWRNLVSVPVKLTHKFPKESVALWLEGRSIDSKEFSLDDRLTAITFLQKLSSMNLYDSVVPIPNGFQKPDVDYLVDILAGLNSFHSAVNTWMSVCKEWLAICYKQHIIEAMKESRLFKSDVSIAEQMVGTQEIALY